MPQTSATFGVARIRCHEKGLISQERMARLCDSSAEEAVRQLVDAGYGNMPGATVEDVESMIESELKETYTLVQEASFKPAVTDVFLMKADVHNLKLLIKLRLTGEANESPAYMAGGLYPVNKLEAMVHDMDYRELPAPFPKELAALEQSFSTHVDPVAVSVALDRAYAEYAYGIGDPFVTEYFKVKTDFDNLLTVLRLRAMNAGPDRIRAALLPEGYISHSRLLSAADMPLDAMGKYVAAGVPAWDSIQKGLDAVTATGRISALERARDNYLIRLASAGKWEFTGIGPIVGYLLGREQEAKCIRLILTAKRNRLPDSIITERLRELYG